MLKAVLPNGDCPPKLTCKRDILVDASLVRAREHETDALSWDGRHVATVALFCRIQRDFGSLKDTSLTLSSINRSGLCLLVVTSTACGW
jgi:hypothetical protein